MGGWLGFLVFMLTIISPIRILLTTAAGLNVESAVKSQIGPNWQIYEILSWVLAAATVSLTLLVAWRLVYVQRRSTVAITIGGLWAIAVLPTLIDVAFGLLLFPEAARAYFTQWLIWELLRSAISPALWSAYLLRSRRVANTYLKDVSETERIFG